ncbi:hypothetical protein [Streptomyces hoynatensis]|uniref:Nucleotidyltransferase domain-containing protein n=1 Tax=Streptomyces hoynatensis TaxID=1141874 RepID=A0A3A9ZBY3_9ACTN|nr:hypothetical protein [Streptomyces hoynatensis]RKN45778.1 hypothetical protein D7294_04800 [Streptomyces hoynatensis]
MFTAQERDAVLERLLGLAREDPRITGAALTGSAAAGHADRWSDLDLFLGVAEGTALPEAAAAFGEFAYRELGALHHFDLVAPPFRYRAFLLPGGLEADLGFAPAGAFGPVGEGGFRLLFGEAAGRRPASAPDVDHLIGLAWHHVLHARISVERGRGWQAEHWIGALRGHVLTLACHRLGLPTAYAKGAHLLPPEVTDPLAEALVRDLGARELRRALSAATRAFLREAREADADLAARLEGPLLDLATGRGEGTA